MPSINDVNHPNLLHKYTADNISGSTLIDLKGTADATLVNTSIINIDGKNYIDQNGVDAYIDFGFLTNRPQNKQPVTLYIKFRLPDTERRNLEWILASSATSAQSGFLIAYDDRRLGGADASITTRRFRVVRYVGNGTTINESGFNNNGEYDINGPLGIGLVSDGTTQHVAVNDQLYNPVTLSSNTSSTQSRHTSSGAWLNPTPSFFGRIQIREIYEFDRALTQEELSDLYNDDNIIASGNILTISQSVELSGCNSFLSSGIWDDTKQWCDADIWRDWPVGSGKITEIIQRVDAVIPAHNSNQIAQTIAIIGGGSILEIEQAVDLKIRGAGVIVGISQSVNSVASGLITRIAQNVQSEDVGVKKFTVELVIDNQIIDNKQIHGDIEIIRSESSAALMNIKLSPPKGLQNITQYQGKEIFLNYIEGESIYRLYTGKVDIPEVDLVNAKITLRCTDNRSEQNNALPRSVVDGIGRYSESVFGEVRDQNDEIEKRLSTVQAALDYDANGQYTFTQWEPKAQADFVLTNASIYRRTPQIEVLSRGRVVNKINLELTYRFQRLRHRERSWTWDYPWNASSWCGFLLDRIGLMRIEGVIRAAESVGWAIKGRVETVGLPTTRWYNCGVRQIGWQTTSRTCDTVAKLDDDGNQVTDSDGRPVFTASNCRIIDSQNVYATSASWTASRRWAQAIEQTINYTVQAPQSIQQYGEVEKSERYGYEYEYDVREWEDYRTHQEPAGMTASPNGDWVLDRRAAELADFESAAQCAIAKARTQIAASHRQNYVKIETPLLPYLDLRHTIELADGKIRCKGKVYYIRHLINTRDKFTETQLQIALSRSAGEAAQTASTNLIYPSVTDQPASPQTIVLGNSIGGRGPDELPDTANGLVTNYVTQRTRKLYTEGFIVDAPAIDAESREIRRVESEQSYNDVIRNDFLEVYFD